MDGQNYRIRPITKNDFQAWFAMRKALWDEASDEEHRTEMMDIFEHTATQLVSVAELENGDLIGFLEASIRPFVEDCHSEHVGYLEGWFVKPDFRQRGVGKKLVKAAEDWARQNGCEEMASDAEIDNSISLQAHLNIGYQETSRLVHLRKDLV